MTSRPPLDARRRKLVFRASHRGIKEMDLLLGSFAAEKLAGLSDGELTAFEALLDVPDQQLLDWVSGREDVPQEHDTAIMAELKALVFRPSDFSTGI